MSIPPLALAATLGLAWIAEHLVEVAIVSATCGILSVAAVVTLMRWADRREARHMAEHPFLVSRPAPATLTATAIPQVSQPERPAIPQVAIFNFYGADGPVAARVIRQALPGMAGGTTTERK